MAEIENNGSLGISASLDTGANSQKAKDFIQDINNMESSVDSLTKTVSASEKQIASIGITSGASGQALKDSFAKLSAALQIYQNETTKTQESTERVKVAAEEFNAQLQKVPETIEALNSHISQLEQKQNNMVSALGGLQQGTKEYDNLNKQIQINTTALTHCRSMASELMGSYSGVASSVGALASSTSALQVISTSAIVGSTAARTAEVAATNAQIDASGRLIQQKQEEVKIVEGMGEVRVGSAKGELQTEEQINAYIKERLDLYHKLRLEKPNSPEVLQEQQSLSSTISFYGRNPAEYDLELTGKRTEATKTHTQTIQEETKADTEQMSVLDQKKQKIKELEAELAQLTSNYKEMLGVGAGAGGIKTWFGEKNAVNEYNSGNVTDEQMAALIAQRDKIQEVKAALKEEKAALKEVEAASKKAAAEETRTEETKKKNSLSTRRIMKELHSSLIDQKVELRNLQQEYDKLASKRTFDAEAPKVKELTQRIEELKNKIKETENELKQEGSTGISGYFHRAKFAVADFMTGSGKFQQNVGNLKTAMGGMIAPLTGLTGGFGAAAKAMWAMCTTPLGAILSVIVLALQAMWQWLNKSVEGQRALTKISAYLGSLFASLSDIVIALGESIFHAFSDNREILHSFAKDFVRTVKTAVKAVVDQFMGLKDIISGTFEGLRTGDFTKVAEGAKRLLKAQAEGLEFLQTAFKTGIEGSIGAAKVVSGIFSDDKLANKVSDAFNNIFVNASKAAKIAEKNWEVERQLSTIKQNEALMDEKIAASREKIYTLSGKEKLAELERLKLLQKEKYDEKISAYRTLADNQKELNSLHETSLKDVAKEKELRTQLYQVVAQQAAATRFTTRMQQFTIKSLANQDKRDQSKENAIKNAEGSYNEIVRSNAIAQALEMMKLEGQITDARIAAMKDGGEKVDAERQRQLEKELDQISAAKDKAVEAERDRQKKEYDAQQAILKARGGAITPWSEEMFDASAVEEIINKFEELAKLANQKYANQEEKQKRDALRDYYKEYGTLEQKLFAAQMAHEDQLLAARKKGASEVGIKAEEQRYQKEIQQIRSASALENVKNDINYVAATESVENVSTQGLEDLYSKLMQAKEALKDLPPDQLQAIASLMKNIEGELINRDPFKEWKKSLEELGKAAVEVAKTKAAVEEASAAFEIAKKNDTVEYYQSVVDQQKKAKEEVGRELMDADDKLADARESGDYSAIIEAENNRNEVLIRQQEIIDSLAQAEKDLNDKRNGVSTDTMIKKQNDLTKAQNAYANALSKESKEKKKVESSRKEIGKGLKELGSQMTEIGNQVDKFGGDAGKYIKAIGGVVSTVGTAMEVSSSNATGAMKTIESATAVLAIISAAIQLATAAADLLGLSKDDSAYEKAKGEYDSLLSTWDSLIDRKKEYLSISWGSEISQTAEEIKALYKNEEEAARRLANERLGAGSSVGSHSYGYRMNRDLRQYFRSIGISDIRDLTKMSSEELQKVKEQQSYFWAKLDDDFREYLEKIIECGDAIKDTNESMMEQFTQMSFDEFYDNFVDTLMNMDASVDDFTNDLKGKFMKALLSQEVGKLYKEDLQKWYNDYAKALDDSGGRLTESQMAYYRKRYEAIVEGALKKRDDLAKATGYDEAAQQQSGTTKGFEGMNQEMASELNGRFTAMQEELIGQSVILTKMSADCTLIQVDVAALKSTIMEQNAYVSEIVDIQHESNGYLSEIARNTSHLEMMAENIRLIKKNTDNL